MLVRLAAGPELYPNIQCWIDWLLPGNQYMLAKDTGPETYAGIRCSQAKDTGPETYPGIRCLQAKDTGPETYPGI
jgi:hypothetical protein